MISMENFFNWMTKPVSKEEVIIWFNVHNMNYEKIELYGDIFMSLYKTAEDTYLGNDDTETKIFLSDEDKKLHFEWCWDKLIENFNRENILIRNKGDHRDYFESFFLDTFYNHKDNNLKVAIPDFLNDVFNLEKDFTKSDLEILTELYKLFEKNID
jgi:hypothetical protein